MRRAGQSSPPCIIGATGGSGTRVVARIVRDAGMFIGKDLNESEDALLFGRFSDRWINAFLTKRANWEWPLYRVAMRMHLRGVVRRHLAPLTASGRPWGWKEPRSVFLMPFFNAELPGLRFLHVVRDGRDIAFSGNQNQLYRHGDVVVGLPRGRWYEPERSIELWSRANLAAMDYGQRTLGPRYLRVRFEDLCSDPTEMVAAILQFFGLSGDVEAIAHKQVSVPASLGRWRTQERALVTELTRIAEAALRAFGYPTEM